MKNRYVSFFITRKELLIMELTGGCHLLGIFMSGTRTFTSILTLLNSASINLEKHTYPNPELVPLHQLFNGNKLLIELKAAITVRPFRVSASLNKMAAPISATGNAYLSPRPHRKWVLYDNRSADKV